MIALGYVTILSFVIVLLLLTELLLSRVLSKELCRKVIHISAFFTYPLALVFFSDAMIHFVIITGVFLLLVIGAYLFHWLKTIDGRKERHPGIVYYCFSIFALALVSYFYPEYSPYLGVSFIGLSFGDGIATIIGTYIPSYKIYKNKSLLGFISCMVATFIGFVIFKYAYFNAFTWEQMILLAILTAIVELVDLGLDNLMIPIILFLSVVLWQYVDTLWIGLIIFESVFVIAFFSKFITYYGSLLASSIGMLYYLALGIFGISFIIGCFASMCCQSCGK